MIMDDRDLIIDAWKRGEVTREKLAEVMKVSVPSVGRLLRKERELKAWERNIVFSALNVPGNQHDFEMKLPDGRTMIAEVKRGTKNIAQAREQLRLSMADLARRTGDIPVGVLYMIEHGDGEVTPEWQQRIADALERDVDELFAERPEFRPARRVPLLGSIPAGNWREAFEHPIALVPCDIGGPNTFSLVVDGDSMGRITESGTRIYVDPDDRGLVDKGLYAVMNADGETTFKRYQSNPARLVPLSENPEHRTLIIGEDGFTTIGRVIAAMQIFY